MIGKTGMTELRLTICETPGYLSASSTVSIDVGNPTLIAGVVDASSCRFEIDQPTADHLRTLSIIVNGEKLGWVELTDREQDDLRRKGHVEIRIAREKEPTPTWSGARFVDGKFAFALTPGQWRVLALRYMQVTQIRGTIDKRSEDRLQQLFNPEGIKFDVHQQAPTLYIDAANVNPIKPTKVEIDIELEIAPAGQLLRWTGESRRTVTLDLAAAEVPEVWQIWVGNDCVYTAEWAARSGPDRFALERAGRTDDQIAATVEIRRLRPTGHEQFPGAVTVTSDSLDIVNITGANDRNFKLYIDWVQTHRLALDLGASAHLCGYCGPQPDRDRASPVAMKVTGPTMPGSHDAAETSGFVWRFDDSLPHNLSVLDDPFAEQSAPLRAGQGEFRVISSSRPDARAEWFHDRALPRLPDVKMLLLHQPDAAAITQAIGLAPERIWAAMVAERVRMAIKGLADDVTDAIRNASKGPGLSLVVAIPGHMPVSVRNRLRSVLREVAAQANETITPRGDNRPDRQIVRLVPEPFALAADVLQEYPASRQVIAIDFGHRTLDLVRLSRDGMGRWQPEACIAADLGGRALDWRILADLIAWAGSPSGLAALPRGDAGYVALFVNGNSGQLAVIDALLAMIASGKETFDPSVGSFVFDPAQVMALGAGAVADDLARMSDPADGKIRVGLAALNQASGGGAIERYLRQVEAFVADGLPDAGMDAGIVFCGGRAVGFAPLRDRITGQMRRGTGRLLFEPDMSGAKRRVICGALRLAEDRALLAGRVEPRLRVLLVDNRDNPERMIAHWETGQEHRAPDDGFVFVAEIGPRQVEMMAGRHLAESLRAYFALGALSQAIPVRKGQTVIPQQTQIMEDVRVVVLDVDGVLGEFRHYRASGID